MKSKFDFHFQQLIIVSFILRMEKEISTHSGILDWKIPWMEEPGRLKSMGW